MTQKRCVYCNDIIPDHLGVYLGGKLYCCQRHAEKGFCGISYCESKL
jgi:hypothetical protein